MMIVGFLKKIRAYKNSHYITLNSQKITKVRVEIGMKRRSTIVIREENEYIKGG